jgi:hypothetical protein
MNADSSPWREPWVCWADVSSCVAAKEMTFCRPLPGLVRLIIGIPRLAPWATLGRCSAAFYCAPGCQKQRCARIQPMRKDLIEYYLPCCIVTVVNRLTKYAALTVLTLWGLAAMHCQLEAVQGLEFLKNCCLVESAASSPDDCTSEGCCAVEESNYRSEEQTAAVPQPFLVLALLSPVIEVPLPELRNCVVIGTQSPPELSKIWQFSHRAARLPRAPSHVV